MLVSKRLEVTAFLLVDVKEEEEGFVGLGERNIFLISELQMLSCVCVDVADDIYLKSSSGSSITHDQNCLS